MLNVLEVHPTTANRWRALVLFGRNVASYKFALGRALLELGSRGDDLVPLKELALPFALAIASSNPGIAAQAVDECPDKIYTCFVSAFDKAMTSAYNRAGWVKKRLR